MEIDRLYFVLFGILMTLLVIITTIVALTMLITIIHYWHPHCQSTSNLLTANSCVTFLFFNLTISIQIARLFGVEQQPPSFCRLRGCLFLIACLVKIASYLIQAISRYFIIVLYKRKTLLTYRTNGWMILIGWIYSLVIGTLMLISSVAFQYESESRLCVFTTKVFHTSFTLMMIAFLMPVSIIIFLYGAIIRYTKRPNLIYPNNFFRNRNKRNIKVFRNILMVVGVLVVGGTPYLISIIANRIDQIPWPFYSISIFFITLSAAIESALLFFTNHDVRKIVYRTLRLRQSQRTLIFKRKTATNTLTNRNGNHTNA